MTKNEYIKYIGDGAAIPGIPARDMTKAEFMKLDVETRAIILACGLYEIRKDK
jgi:hypothetical protein